jgi:hypothetical protein
LHQSTQTQRYQTHVSKFASHATSPSSDSEHQSPGPAYPLRPPRPPRKTPGRPGPALRVACVVPGGEGESSEGCRQSQDAFPATAQPVGHRQCLVELRALRALRGYAPDPTPGALPQTPLGARPPTPIPSGVSTSACRSGGHVTRHTPRVPRSADAASRR